MKNILDVYLCGITFILEIISVIGIAMLMQLISYQYFGINLYQKLNSNLNKLDRYLTNLFF